MQSWRWGYPCLAVAPENHCRHSRMTRLFRYICGLPALYEKYAPYVQAQLPDVNIEFIVGNNDLDFYKFLRQNGGLPDIITCCRFSLHDAAPLKDSLMNLATTNEAGAIYNTYLNSFKNEDGSINWLPVCPDVHGLWSTATFLSSIIFRCPTITQALLQPVKNLRK